MKKLNRIACLLVPVVLAALSINATAQNVIDKEFVKNGDAVESNNPVVQVSQVDETALVLKLDRGCSGELTYTRGNGNEVITVPCKFANAPVTLKKQ